MSATEMTPLADLDAPTLVIARKATWAHNWASRERLRDPVCARLDLLTEDVLRGLPEGITVHLLSLRMDDLPASHRQQLLALDANVVEHG